jgi:hypothetical protein
MRFTGARLDVIYEARFAQPSMDFATDPRPLIKGLVASIASRFPIAARDVVVTPSTRASEVRLRMQVFNGQGTIEVDAEKLGLHFQNALAADDFNTIRDAIKLTLDGVVQGLPNDRFAEHTLRTLMWLQLLDEPTDGQAFIGSLSTSKVDGIANNIPTLPGIKFAPGIKFELEHPEDRWLFTYELSRAFRSKAEVFQSATLACFDRSSVATMEDRTTLLESLLTGTWEHLGIQPSGKKT